jgi:hypothetical protein
MNCEAKISKLAPSLASIAPPFKLHVPRQELERKFEIVLFTENARRELKSSAKES